MAFLQIVTTDVLLSHLAYVPSWGGRNISVKGPILSPLAVEGVWVSGSDQKLICWVAEQRQLPPLCRWDYYDN